jgi:hypothetical protein
MMNISKLIDANMVGKFKYLPAFMGMEIADDDGTVINSGISSDMFNIVCRARDKNALSSALQKFRNLKLPFAWWVGFDDDYPECKNDLEKMGFICDEHESGMFSEIEKLSREKKCDKLQISLVDDAKKLDDFVQIYQELIPHDAKVIGEFFGRASAHILNPESSLKLFVGYFQDHQAATSALFLDENTAGVCDVTTLPQFRHRVIRIESVVAGSVRLFPGAQFAVDGIQKFADGGAFKEQKLPGSILILQRMWLPTLAPVFCVKSEIMLKEEFKAQFCLVDIRNFSEKL